MLHKVEVITKYSNLSATDTYTVFVAAENEREAEQKAAESVRKYRNDPALEVAAASMSTIESLIVNRATGFFTEG